MEISREQLNARRPELDEYGNAVLERMNKSHNELYLWGVSHVPLADKKHIVDIGCGGGKNIKNLSELLPKADFLGIDISEASVRKTLEVNSENVKSGRVKAKVGSAEKLPVGKPCFDLATAFETVYYWENIVACFENVRKTLKDGGAFLVCNEDKDTSRISEVASALGMNLYTAKDLKHLLEAAGFKNVEAFEHYNSRWVCAIGYK